MTKENLIPIRTTERAKELGRLGGQKKSLARELAYKFRPIKRRSPFFAFLMEISKTDDPEKAVQYYLDNFDQMERNILEGEKAGKDTFYKRSFLLQRFNEFMKFKFGETHKNINLHVVAYKDDLSWAQQSFVKMSKGNKDSI